MENTDMVSFTPDDLKAYMEAHKERDYLLVDVRQPAEYAEAHIPGSHLLPLMELQTRLFDLPPDRDLIFYCHVGGRSLMAADLAVEGEVSEKMVYHLDGGILAWHGKLLADHPRVQVFDKTAGVQELLMTAMELEKGAWRFYRDALQRYAAEPFADTLERLSQAETAHAKAIYRFWQKAEEDPADFEELFDRLPGEVLEGGEPLADVLKRLETLTGNPCINLMELALRIEYAAFDLYRVMGDRTGEAAAREVFLSIAQAEKRHMRMLAEAVPRCPGG